MKRARNYKIAILSDLKAGSDILIKNSLGLADIIGGEVELFHVIHSTDAIKSDNQFSALRSIKDEFAVTEKKIQNLIGPLEKSGKSLVYRLSYGNVKNEIAQYIEEKNPDIIVLGKRKSNPFDFIGDRLTKWILNEYPGLVMIASEEYELEPGHKLSLGLLNASTYLNSIDVFEDLLPSIEEPIKSFSFSGMNQNAIADGATLDKKVISYVFEKGENSLNNLSNYVSKNNINLLWLEYDDANSQNTVTDYKELNSVIGKLDVPILMTRNRRTLKQQT